MKYRCKKKRQYIDFEMVKGEECLSLDRDGSTIFICNNLVIEPDEAAFKSPLVKLA